MTYADSGTDAGIAAVTSDDDPSPPLQHCICKVEMSRSSSIAATMLKKETDTLDRVICPSNYKNIETHVLHLLIGGIFFIILWLKM